MSDFLQKKNHTSGMSQSLSVAPGQPVGKQRSASSVRNTAKQSYDNTKAQVKTHVPHGKPHAKVIGNNPTTHGTYL